MQIGQDLQQNQQISAQPSFQGLNSQALRLGLSFKDSQTLAQLWIKHSRQNQLWRFQFVEILRELGVCQSHKDCLDINKYLKDQFVVTLDYEKTCLFYLQVKSLLLAVFDHQQQAIRNTFSFLAESSKNVKRCDILSLLETQFGIRSETVSAMFQEQSYQVQNFTRTLNGLQDSQAKYEDSFKSFHNYVFSQTGTQRFHKFQDKIKQHNK